MIKKITRKEFEKKLGKSFGRTRKEIHTEGGKTKVIVYSSIAKKSTPEKHISLDSPYWRGKRKCGQKRVHVGTYVPKNKHFHTFPSMKKYVKK